jgi:hypothetical protein
MTQGFAPVQKPAPMPAKVLDAKVFGKRLQECFAAIEDPRVERTRAHQLSDILTIAILSTIAGGQGWEDMEIYGLVNPNFSQAGEPWRKRGDSAN